MLFDWAALRFAHTNASTKRTRDWKKPRVEKKMFEFVTLAKALQFPNRSSNSQKTALHNTIVNVTEKYSERVRRRKNPNKNLFVSNLDPICIFYFLSIEFVYSPSHALVCIRISQCQSPFDSIEIFRERREMWSVAIFGQAKGNKKHEMQRGRKG